MEGQVEPNMAARAANDKRVEYRPQAHSGTPATKAPSSLWEKDTLARGELQLIAGRRRTGHFLRVGKLGGQLQ
ncbi:hypothetical protein chiPu_0031241, partial [Chiloscyllium punctatum]|nr:hypothetical protein [Chiloscyllium punctatum]